MITTCVGKNLNIRSLWVSCNNLNYPKWKCGQISMDFPMILPKTLMGFNTALVLGGRLTKSAHFLPIKETKKMENLTKTYLK